MKWLFLVRRIYCLRHCVQDFELITSGSRVQDLCESSADAKALFDKASDILGYDLLAVCTEGAVIVSTGCKLNMLCPLALNV
jgi:hypothetical protein